MELIVKWRIATSVLIWTIFLFPIIIHGFMKENSDAMRLELIHRHDPRLNHNMIRTSDKLDVLRDLAHKDVMRYHMISHRQRKSRGRNDWETSFQMPMHGGRDYGVGEYFVEIEVGTPAQKFLLIADTGSDLTWIHCRYKCGNNCSTHTGKSKKNSQRLFIADHSATFETVTCISLKCTVELKDLFSLTTCPIPSDPCQYDFSYIDGSSVLGFFAVEAITVSLRSGRKAKLFNVLIGCTQSTSGGQVFNEGVDGVLGLGYAQESFVAKATPDYGGKFSYCLVDHLSPKNVSSYLTFGDSTHNTKFSSTLRRTKLVSIGSSYGVNVLGISVGGELLSIPAEVWDSSLGGGTLLDSGTSLTILTKPAYEPVVAALGMSLTRYGRVNTTIEPFDHCFNATGFNETSVPRLSVHFTDGARFEPPVKSYIIDVAPQTKCIGFISTAWPGTSVIGNILQQNHLWEFDLFQSTVGFTSSSCT